MAYTLEVHDPAASISRLEAEMAVLRALRAGPAPPGSGAFLEAFVPVAIGIERLFLLVRNTPGMENVQLRVAALMDEIIAWSDALPPPAPAVQETASASAPAPAPAPAPGPAPGLTD
jgi:hypothetical protein